MPQLHRIFGGIFILVAVLVGVLIFISGGAVIYGVNIDNSGFDSINQSSAQIISLGQDVTGETTNLEGDSNVQDPTTGFFTRGYSAILVVGQGIDIMLNMFRSIPSMLGLAPSASGYVKTVIDLLSMTFVIVIVIGVYLAIATRSERA